MLAVTPIAYQITPVMHDQNVYVHGTVNRDLAMRQHEDLCAALRPDVAVIGQPDAVFASNAALYLPRLPEPVMVLANMKYASRRRESRSFQKILEGMHIKVVPFPDEIFEGQGEALWFHDGRLLLLGYGFRATARTVSSMRRLLSAIYRSYGVLPPTVLGLELISPYFYHLDVAMLRVAERECVVHAGSVSVAGMRTIRTQLKVTVINVPDVFCLNSIRVHNTLFTHRLAPVIKRLLAAITRCEIKEINVSEFEKAGGSVRCMILDLPRKV